MEGTRLGYARMAVVPNALDADWLAVCRRAASGLRRILEAAPTTRERVRETGERGQGGDHTLLIDAAAEDAIFAELQWLYDEGYRFTAVSEERGEVDFGDPGVIVIIDPIDGSMNAKRRLPHHAISIAVADGPTMADVAFGYVYDYGPGEEWWAFRGQGAFRDGERLDPDEFEERRAADGRLEILGVESADPRWLAEVADRLADSSHRIRALGTIAVSLCQLAAARFDGMVTLKGCRAVDAAAGQLIVREAGGLVSFIRFEDPLAAPLDLIPHSPLVAARTDEALAELARIPR
jgi:myo-inositol-1(or 4)-monophosphatase